MQAMQVSLTNLGTSARVVYDRHQHPVFIGIGRAVDVDVTQEAIDNIERFPEETLIVGAPGEGAVPEKLKAITDLLSVIEFEEYSILLVKFLGVDPAADETKTRPSRSVMRIRLRELVAEYIAQNRKPALVHDDVDPAVLQRELDEQKPQVEEKSAPPLEPEKPRRAGRR